jgi:hypothetical protein
MPLPLLRHGLVGGVPSGGDTSSFLQERGETGVRVYQEDVLQGGVKQLNITPFSGQEWVFQQDSVPAKSQDDLRVAAEEITGLYQRRGLALGESIPQPPGL